VPEFFRSWIRISTCGSARVRWLELLDGIGAAAAITVRVPSPLTDGPNVAAAPAQPTQPSLTQAAARLREARGQLRDRSWDQAVATCRKVLENIAALVTLPTAGSLRAINASDRTKEQRWAASYYDLCSLTSAAHHETSKITFDQADAESILAMTAALLRNYAR
jgi:hypothetical protein